MECSVNNTLSRFRWISIQTQASKNRGHSSNRYSYSQQTAKTLAKAVLARSCADHIPLAFHELAGRRPNDTAFGTHSSSALAGTYLVPGSANSTDIEGRSGTWRMVHIGSKGASSSSIAPRQRRDSCRLPRSGRMDVRGGLSLALGH